MEHQERNFFVKNKVRILVFVVLLFFGSSLYLWNKVNQLQKDPEQIRVEEAEALVGRLGEIVRLPQDEVPTVATVGDVDQLRGQDFFKYAENGFKVIVYSKEQKAILYDPKKHMIIEIAPLSFDDSKVQ